MKKIAIIPARSGSKGLPNKNIIELNNKPLIFYSITAALESGCFDEVMVSTDSNYYAEIARQYGASVPFLRSAKNSGDDSDSWGVVREVLAQYDKNGKKFDYVALLQPTSPLRDKNDIIQAFKMLSKNNVHNVVSITEVEHPVQWCFKMSDDKSMEQFADSPFNNIRRQDLEKYYRENGAIYIVDAEKIMSENYNFYGDDCYGYIMPKERSVDIDSEMDIYIVKYYMNI